jgi:hypothetical protein
MKSMLSLFFWLLTSGFWILLFMLSSRRFPIPFTSGSKLARLYG